MLAIFVRDFPCRETAKRTIQLNGQHRLSPPLSLSLSFGCVARARSVSPRPLTRAIYLNGDNTANESYRFPRNRYSHAPLVRLSQSVLKIAHRFNIAEGCWTRARALGSRSCRKIARHRDARTTHGARCRDAISSERVKLDVYGGNVTSLG